jgi:ribosomal protein S16
MPYSDHGNDAAEGDMTMTELTNAQLFAQLNTFRLRAGKAELKVLKISRAQLIEQLGKFAPIATPETKAPDMPSIDNRGTLPSDVIADTTQQGTAQPEKTAKLKQARITNAAKDAALAKLEAEKPSPSLTEGQKAVKRRQAAAKGGAAKSAKKTSGEPSAAEVAGEFGIAPKVARALLRKHGIDRTAAAMRAFFKARAK